MELADPLDVLSHTAIRRCPPNTTAIYDKTITSDHAAFIVISCGASFLDRPSEARSGPQERTNELICSVAQMGWAYDTIIDRAPRTTRAMKITKVTVKSLSLLQTDQYSAVR